MMATHGTRIFLACAGLFSVLCFGTDHTVSTANRIQTGTNEASRQAEADRIVEQMRGFLMTGQPDGRITAREYRRREVLRAAVLNDSSANVRRAAQMAIDKIQKD